MGNINNPNKNDKVSDTYTVEVTSVSDSEIGLRVRKWTANDVLESFSFGETIENAFGSALGDLDCQEKSN